MPPKRGRGGRPRGASTALDRTISQIDDNVANRLTESIPDLGPDLAPSSQTVQSPNSSPVSAPTETPASTPVRTPVQRLDSLGVLNSRGGSKTRGGMAARGTRGSSAAPAAASRFKPKAVRRGAEEREKAAREEAERVAMKEKDMARLERLANRGRGRGRGDARGRGRGDAMGMRGRGGASGPFGAAPQSDKKGGFFAPGSGPIGGIRSSNGGGGSSGIGGGGGGGGGSSGSSGIRTIKLEAGGMSHYTSKQIGTEGARVEDEYAIPIYPEDQQEGGDGIPRINIERINLISDDEGSDVEARSIKSKGKSTAKSSKSGMRPVRLNREEHKERVQMVNTEPATASLPKEEEDPVPAGDDTSNLFVDEVATKAAARRPREREWSGVWQENEPVIKADPDAPDSNTLADIMEIDSSTTTPAPTIGSDSKVPSELLDKELSHPQHGTETSRKQKVKRSSSIKERKPVLQTEEDRAEYERHCQDVRILAHELGGFQTAMGAESAADDMDLDQELPDLEGRLYLLQFPPILPPLLNPVKKEEPDTGHSGLTGVSIAGASNNQISSADLTNPTDSTEAVEVRHEPGVFIASRETIPEPGLVGKLVVRQSGKVELDWGGTSLQLEKGAVFDFLASTLIVDPEEEITESEALGYGAQDGRRGRGTGMGQVMGKFVLTPDWDKLFKAAG